MATKATDEENEKTSSESFNIKQFLQLLWINKYWILFSVLVCVGLAMYKAYRTPTDYKSSAQMMILSGYNRGAASSASVADFSDLRGLTGDINLANEMEVLRSPVLMAQVVRKLDLNTMYTTPAFGYDEDLYGKSPVSVNFLDIPQDSSASVKLSKIDSGRVRVYDFVRNGRSIDTPGLIVPLGVTVKTPVGRLLVGGTMNYSNFDSPITASRIDLHSMAANLANTVNTANESTRNSVILITVINRSQKKAADIVNALMEAYNAAWIEEKNRSAVNTSEFIKERLAVIEKELSGIDADISAVKSSSVMPDFGAAASQYMSQSAQYDNRAFELSNQASIARFLLDYVRDPSKSQRMIPANSGVGAGAVESQIQEYNRMLMQRDNLREQSSDNNPVVAELNSNLASMRQMIIISLENHLATLQMQANRTTGREQMFTSKVSSVPSQEKQILSIERQQKVKENLYLYLLQKREENELSGMITVNNTKILREAKFEGPVEHLKLKIIGIGFLIGLLLPCAIIYLINLMDTKVHSKEDFSKLGIPFIGEVPLSMRAAGKRKKFSLHKLLHPSSRRLDDANLMIVIKERSRSSINEAFRMIRTNLDFMMPDTDRCQTLLVTSFNPGSGKTFISLNLGTSLALKNKRVLVLDLDLRRASASRFIGSPTQGVSTFLLGKTANVMDLVVRKPERALIDILPVGALPPNPAELLLSTKLDTMMEQLRANYDYIIIDCPPYNIVADTSIIAREADMSIFVARFGVLEKNMLNVLKETYDENKLPHLSIILNGVSTNHGAYMYRYGYGYGYGYGGSYGYYYEDDDEKDEVTDNTK